ncbi:MAG: hypothetical protein HYT09_01700 [Candidatus Levybacteria bacterium]|nr:hypothetical protein [Candidatus Levybacteria bacterium]
MEQVFLNKLYGLAQAEMQLWRGKMRAKLKLAALRDLLLPKLMSGEVRV